MDYSQKNPLVSMDYSRKTLWSPWIIQKYWGVVRLNLMMVVVNVYPANTRYSINVGLMLGQYHRPWPSNKTTLGQGLVCGEIRAFFY